MPVGPLPSRRAEQRARTHPAAVVREIGDEGVGQRAAVRLVKLGSSQLSRDSRERSSRTTRESGLWRTTGRLAHVPGLQIPPLASTGWLTEPGSAPGDLVEKRSRLTGTLRQFVLDWRLREAQSACEQSWLAARSSGNGRRFAVLPSANPVRATLGQRRNPVLPLALTKGLSRLVGRPSVEHV